MHFDVDVARLAGRAGRHLSGSIGRGARGRERRRRDRSQGALRHLGELGFDALIEPSIDAFEFSVPNQSQTEEFAVWFRYRIKIYDPDGNVVANWPIAAYGKALSTMFGGDEALRRAAVLAMRDAAALIIMQMDKSTGVSKLAQARPETVRTTAAEETADDSG